MNKALLLAGATGLVGSEVLAAARSDDAPVQALVRRVPASAGSDPGVLWQAVDFARLPPLPPADEALCALGTTIKVAGSQAAFRAVDFDAVLSFATAAHTAGVRHFGLVSALGADAGSRNFYLRVKGEAEAALAAIGFDTLVIARPSLLAGDRTVLGQPERHGEKLGMKVSALLGPLLPLGWRPVQARSVARALRAALAERRPGVRYVESAELQRLGA